MREWIEPHWKRILVINAYLGLPTNESKALLIQQGYSYIQGIV